VSQPSRVRIPPSPPGRKLKKGRPQLFFVRKENERDENPIRGVRQMAEGDDQSHILRPENIAVNSVKLFL
jgi:hypothetical protein